MLLQWRVYFSKVIATISLQDLSKNIICTRTSRINMSTFLFFSFFGMKNEEHLSNTLLFFFCFLIAFWSMRISTCICSRVISSYLDTQTYISILLACCWSTQFTSFEFPTCCLFESHGEWSGWGPLGQGFVRCEVRGCTTSYIQNFTQRLWYKT